MGNQLKKYFVVVLLAMTVLPVISIVAASQSKPAGDPISGKSVYQRCQACHSLKRNRTGPKHCGLFGRRAGSVRGYDYSDAMGRSKIVWDQITLDEFLRSPFKAVPGTTMGYGGVWNEKDRTNLIAYLQQVSNSAQCK